jgi:ABC-type multidrug transport system fused ATPase/permease subunit
MQGDLMQRLTTDTAALSAAAGDFVGQRGLRSVVEVVASVTIIMTINYKLALVSLFVAPVLAFITRLITSRSASIAVEVQAAAGAAMSTLSEVLAAMRTVVVFAQEPRCVRGLQGPCRVM